MAEIGTRAREGSVEQTLELHSQQPIMSAALSVQGILSWLQMGHVSCCLW